MGLVADVHGVAAQEVEELLEDFGRPAGHGWRQDGWRTQETFPLQPGKDLVRGGEEDGEAEGEVVGRVARCREEVARDLELLVAYGYEDGLFIELGYEFGYFDARVSTTARVRVS